MRFEEQVRDRRRRAGGGDLLLGHPAPGERGAAAHPARPRLRPARRAGGVRLLALVGPRVAPAGPPGRGHPPDPHRRGDPAARDARRTPSTGCERIALFEFPHPGFFETLSAANSAGWITVYDVLDDWEEFHRVGQAIWYDEPFERHLITACDAVFAINEHPGRPHPRSSAASRVGDRGQRLQAGARGGARASAPRRGARSRWATSDTSRAPGSTGS